MTGEISALSSPAFRKYLCGILAANMGFRIQAIALAILVYRTTGSALDLGIVSAIGGVLADRYDTRIVWAVNSGLSAALIGLLGWLTFNDAVPISQIYVLAALMGVVAGVNMPLSQRLLPIPGPTERTQVGRYLQQHQHVDRLDLRSDPGGADHRGGRPVGRLCRRRTLLELAGPYRAHIARSPRRAAPE